MPSVNVDWCSALLAQNLKPFGLLLAVYDPSSVVSRALAYVTVVPPLSIVFLLGVLAATRRGRVLQLWVTLIASFALNELLKNVVQQPRPSRSWMHGYGMPSSHTASVATSFVFVECLLLAGLWSLPPLTRWLWRVLMLALVLAVVLARASVHAHSLEQCFVGAAMGALYALLSFVLVPARLVASSERAMERVAARVLGAANRSAPSAGERDSVKNE